MARATPSGGRGRAVGSVAFWFVDGALGAFGVAAALTVGAYFLALGALLLVAGILVPWIDVRALPAVVIGAAAAPLYIAWLNRGGPGVVCSTVADGMNCTQEWSPWPFVAVGLVLVLGGAALLRRTYP